MSFRTGLLPTIVKLRELTGPTGYDINTSRIIFRRRVWSGGEVKLGHPTDTDIELFPRPRVRDANSSGGIIVNVGPITPRNLNGGYTPNELNPQDEPGVENYYILIAPDGIERRYKLVEFDQKKPFRYMLKLQAIDRVVPF